MTWFTRGGDSPVLRPQAHRPIRGWIPPESVAEATAQPDETTEDVSPLSRMKSPLAGQGLGQKIATIALVLLALIAALAFFGRSSGDGGGSPSSSRFTQASYSGGESRAALSGVSAHRSSSASRTSNGSTSGLPTVRLGELPREAQTTASLIKAGGPFPYKRDGIVFGNYEGLLPAHPRGWYHEYTVPTQGMSSRGVRRLITGKDATMYYTGDHYKSFKTVVE